MSTPETLELAADGLPVKLGRVTYIMPPLPLAKMHVARRMMEGGEFEKHPEYSASVVDSIYHSLLRNYKGLDRGVVEDNLDMLNIQEVIQAFQKVNGFIPKADGSVQPEAGNTTAG
jgi:hypothetical protein